MISRTRHSSVGLGDLTIPYKPIIENILMFIDSYLPAFPNFAINNELNIPNEKLINQALVEYLTGCSIDNGTSKHSIYKFIFTKDDERPGTNSKPDIGVKLWSNSNMSESIFQIECKRLPTPSPSVNRSEREYVKGFNSDGGIERFKIRSHGAHLENAALVGYIEVDSIDTWHSTITSWITDLIDDVNERLWDESDLLKNPHVICPHLERFKAKHNRTYGNAIVTYHYLLKMQ